MAKKDSGVVESSTEIFDKHGDVVNKFVPASEAPSSKPSGGDKLTFGMFCAIRRIAPQRQAGLRAFTATQYASLTEWDAIFKKY